MDSLIIQPTSLNSVSDPYWDTSIAEQISFTYAPGISVDQMIGFELAGLFWSNLLADDVDVNILVEMTDYLPGNAIGGALPGIEADVSYSNFRHNLTQDITSDIDFSVDSNQQETTDNYTAFFRSQFDDLTGYEVSNNEYLKMTRANAKALGIREANDSSLDGYILMRNLDGSGSSGLESLSWQYNYSNNAIESNSLDFLSVAIHEVGHILGFVSGLDQADWLAGLENVNPGEEASYYAGLAGSLNNATPVDMLRFSQESHQESGGKNWNDLSLGGNPFLSFTGSGGKAIAQFATGKNTRLGGDGNQASHWKENGSSPLGIMDPTLSAGQRRHISKLDTELFDAIGWDVEQGKGSVLSSIKKQVQAHYGYKLEDVISGLQTIPTDSLIQNFQDNNLNGYDDRDEQLEEMLANSGEVYEWGWKGHWPLPKTSNSNHHQVLSLKDIDWDTLRGAFVGDDPVVNDQPTSSDDTSQASSGGDDWDTNQNELLQNYSLWQNFSWQTVDVSSTTAADEPMPAQESTEMSSPNLAFFNITVPDFSQPSSSTVLDLDLDIESQDDAARDDDEATYLENFVPLKLKINQDYNWDDLVATHWGWKGHWPKP